MPGYLNNGINVTTQHDRVVYAQVGPTVMDEMPRKGTFVAFFSCPPLRLLHDKQFDGQTYNVNTSQGTATFWYQPSYDHVAGNFPPGTPNTGPRSRLFCIGEWGLPGSFCLERG